MMWLGIIIVALIVVAVGVLRVAWLIGELAFQLTALVIALLKAAITGVSVIHGQRPTR